MALNIGKEEMNMWKAEKFGYTKAFSAIKGDTLRVLDIDSAHEGQIGYTSADKTIHLAYDHEAMKGLNAQGKRAFRCGVGTHELMHQLLTDFVITNRALVPLPGVEKEILAMISNYLEDARIEHFAYQFVGGTYLKCLEFAIAWSYKTAPRLEECDSAFSQFIMAIQQLGDQGVLKGRFTYPEAKEIFAKAAPIFYKGTIETNPRRAMKYAKEIFELSRPLWKEQKDMEELMKKLMEDAEKRGKSMHKDGGSGKPSTEASEDDGEGGGASARRKMTVKEVSRREFEEAADGSSGKGSGSGQMVKAKDATTAEEAAEAAEEAAEDAADAQDAANDAKRAAEEAKGSANESKAQRAAEKAQAAADRAKSAAESAKSHADASADAKAKGDEEGERENAIKAGKDALRANAAAKSAQRADDQANGNDSSNGSSAKTAQDAKEMADDAQASADAAESAAEEAEKKAEEAAASGDAEEAEKAKKNAERAREAADKAKEAAKRAAESAEKSESAQEAADEYGESANARNAEKAAKEAAREAAKAERAANGQTAQPGEKANDAEMMDYSQAGETDSMGSEVTDRAINGARPDYSNCADELTEEEWDPTPTEFNVEDYALSDDDFASIETEVQSCLEAVEKEEANASREDEVALPDFEISSARIGKATSCLNRKIKVDDVDHAMDLYGQLMTKLRPGINSLYGRLRNIFQNDLEVTDYRSSGRLNYKRVNSGRMTARVFDKHRLPSEKAKTAVLILVDESGSMSGRNAETAKQTAIALAETFYKLAIPVYIIGFTADTSGHDAVHNHYVTWKNSMNERLRLLDITARCNNFDGYSIRYGGELLKKVNAEHKLMIVVSDGSPACSKYSGVDGIADTKDAIRSVKSHSDVLGVLIGSYDVSTLQGMYGNDFINVKNVSELFSSLAKRIVHIVNKWD